MHLKRWITAAIGVPILILLICKGGQLLFALFIAVVSVISLWEYFRIVFNKTGKSTFGLIPLWGYITGLLIVCAAYYKSLDIILGLLVLNVLVSGFISVFQYKSDPAISDVVAKQTQGIIYVPVLISCIVLLRNSTDGVAWIFLLLILVFIGDTGAFYAGRFFGKNKLCPAVSPGKTIEGFLGGLAFCVAAGILFRHFFLPELPLVLSIVFFLCLGIVGPVGDLSESIHKRTGDIKDSGVILPGHGGFLDRIDALLFAAPVAYLFKEYIL